MAINKVIVNGETKLDLTADTATADKVLKGFTFHDATGELKTGTNEGGIDGYYVKKVFDHNDVISYRSVHVEFTTEGKYGLFHISEGYGSLQILNWQNDTQYSGGSPTVYAISTKPITAIDYWDNFSSASSSSSY